MVASECCLAFLEVPKGFLEWSGYIGGFILGCVFLVYAFKDKNILGKRHVKE